MFGGHIWFERHTCQGPPPSQTLFKNRFSFNKVAEMIIESMTEGVFRTSFIPSLNTDHFPMLNTHYRVLWGR